jgi:hypothetical protein
MRYRLLFFLIITFLLSGCNGWSEKNKFDVSKKSLTGSWRLYDLENNSKKNPKADKLLSEAASNEIIRQGIMLSFFEDGSFTEMRGSGFYRTGKWRYNSKEKMLYLTDATNTVSINVKPEIINNNQTISLAPTSTQTGLKFIRNADPLENFDEDPYYFKNNLWRIKPGQSETHDQLVKRLGNYFRHLLYILKASKDRKQSVVSFEFSQGLVKIYNGGIGIIPYTSVNENWINTYFDDDNAREAYQMFQKYLATNSYRGASIGDWIQDDYNILLGIYGDTEKGKF